MTLAHRDTLENWRGERINGVSYPRIIAQRWPVDELKAIGLAHVRRESRPAGKVRDGDRVRALVGDEIVETEPFRDRTQAERDAHKAERVDGISQVVLRTLLDHENRLRKLEGDPPLGIAAFKSLLRGRA